MIGGRKTSAQLGATPSGTSKLKPEHDNLRSTGRNIRPLLSRHGTVLAKGEVRAGLGSGRIPPTVSVGDGDASARGCLSPNLTDNLAAFNCQKSSVLYVCGSTRPGPEGLYAL